FTADAVARLVGNTQSEVSAILLEGDDYAVLPDGATWESKDKYYSGELWPKYDAAMAASTNTASPEWLRQRLATQAARLHEKIAPIGLEQVEIQMNSGFITPDDLTAWLEDRPRHHVGSSHDTPQPAYVTFEDAVYTITPAHATNWLSNDNKLITAYLNREGVKKDEIGAVELLNAEFRLWVLGGPHRDAIENRYNRTYRGFAQREYSSEPISIPGLNPDRSLNGYHYAALRWAIEMGGGISAYDVGLGKTTFGLILSRLSVAMGRAERPAFVVPLSVISNWEAEAKSWFPGCTTMVIGETRVTKKDGTISAKSDSAAVIRTKLLQAQQNNVDFVFITEPAWNRLDLNPEKKAALVDQDFWVQRGNTLGHAGTKRQNKVKEQFKQAAAARDFDAREDTLYFEDLKFDMLVVDEMHRYKNLYSPRNRWGGAPKYLGGSGQSNRAHDTYLKAAELRERTGGLNIFGLTASPSKNSPLEIYSLMSLVSPEAFDRMGIRNSEEFLDRFCTFEIQPILNLQGEIEEATVVSGFKNLDELLPIMERFIYRKTAEDVGLKIPDAEPVVHITDMTDTQAKVY
ncbi:MAG: hypothetical protein KGL65_10750, partial [Rhodospirillales bacterium]|nr:hypothetical protein [Rhodospirillales bacterium]